MLAAAPGTEPVLEKEPLLSCLALSRAAQVLRTHFRRYTLNGIFLTLCDSSAPFTSLPLPTQGNLDRAAVRVGVEGKLWKEGVRPALCAASASGL